MPDFEKPDGAYNDMGNRYPTVDHLIVGGERYTMGGLASALAERAALDTQLSLARERTREGNARYVAFQAHVHSVFAELVVDGDLPKDVANEALDGLGLDRLSTEYAVEVTHTATLYVTSTLSPKDLATALAEAGARLEVGEGADFDVEDEHNSSFEVGDVKESAL
jgi:hypothetical protein